MKRGNIKMGEDADFSRYNWSNQDLDEFSKKLSSVASFLKKPVTDNNIQILYSDFDYLVSKVPLPLIPVEFNFLLRARHNKKDEIFKEESEISYNSKNTEYIDLNRFNLRKQSMFYGALPSNEEQGRWLATVTLECHKEVVDKEDAEPWHYFTLGRWEIQSRLHVINLCFNDQTVTVSPWIKKNIDYYINEIQTKLTKNSSKFLINYWRFLSDLSCAKADSERRQHCISTVLMLAVRSVYEDEFNGILYPSSMTDNEGVNIVLTPEAVNKYLKLSQAVMYKLVRDKDNHHTYHGSECSKTVPVENGLFTIVPFEEDRLILFS